MVFSVTTNVDHFETKDAGEGTRLLDITITDKTSTTNVAVEGTATPLQIKHNRNYACPKPATAGCSINLLLLTHRT
jgi:hypothetical protein